MGEQATGNSRKIRPNEILIVNSSSTSSDSTVIVITSRCRLQHASQKEEVDWMMFFCVCAGSVSVNDEDSAKQRTVRGHSWTQSADRTISCQQQ